MSAVTLYQAIFSRHPNATKVLRGMPYRGFLRTEYWQIIRKLVFHRDKYACVRCGAIDRLEAHHKTYENLGNELFHLDDLETLCRVHHKLEHNIPTGESDYGKFIPLKQLVDSYIQEHGLAGSV